MRSALLAAFLLSGLAFGQGRPAAVYPTLDLSRLEFNPGAEDSLLVASGRLSEVGRLRVSLLAEYLDAPAYTRIGGDSAGLRLAHRTQGLAQLAYTPAHWLQVHAQLPVIMGQAGLPSGTSGAFPQPEQNGLATPTVGLRVAFLRQSEQMPLSFAVGFTGSLPAGSSAALARDRDPRLVPNLSLGRDFGAVQVGLQAHLRLRAPENFAFRGVSSDLNDTVTHELGGGIAASSSVTKDLRAEVAVLADFALENGGATVQTFGGVRYALNNNAELFAGGGPAFGTLSGTPNFRVLGGLSFQVGPRPSASSGATIASAETPHAAPAPSSRTEQQPSRETAAPSPAPASELLTELKLDPEPQEQSAGPAKPAVTLDQIHFETGRAELAPRSKPVLLKIARHLIAHPEIATLRVEGHTDNGGTTETNLALSTARSRAVRSFLIAHGVEAQRLEAVGFGATRPIADNASESGREANRRVGFVIVETARP